MFKISESQLSVFKREALSSFEDKVTSHLFTLAPRHCGAIGEDAVRASVRLGVHRAGRYGLTKVGPVRLFIELMYMFGSDFDTDPLLGWASETLTDTGLSDQMHRADCLYGHTQNYLEFVVGAKGCHALSAHQRVSLVCRGPQRSPAEGPLVEWLQTRLASIYPEKCVYAGEGALTRFTRKGIDEAAGRGLTKAWDIALCVSLMLFLGHGITGDPLFPWIAGALTGKNSDIDLTAWLEQRLRVDTKLVFDDISED